MSLTIVAQGPEHRDAVAAFNQRLRDALGQPPFLLPLDPAPDPWHKLHISSCHYVALEEGEVRGGYRIVVYPAVLNGEPVTAVNLQSPLSESVIDKRYRHVAPEMITDLVRKQPIAFEVGMGSLEARLPKRLRSLGWSVEEVPFLFRVHRANRFFTEMPMFNSPWFRRWGARVAALSGLGSAGCLWLHRKRKKLPSGLRLLRESSWGDWADAVWHAFRPELRFGVRRDAAVLEELYPPEEPRLRIYRVVRGEQTLGWAAALLTQMRDNRYFGNLRVGTVLDAAAQPEAFFAVAALADEALEAEGADLVITNQSLPRWQEAFRDAGFLRGPSNYLCACSPALVEALSPSPVSDGLVHVVRGDGPGRIHL